MIKQDTKSIIADTAEELLKTQKIEEISIQQIVDKCNATRTTFYRHFKDKYELMNWVYARNVDTIIMLYNDGKDIRKLSIEILKFIKSKKEYFYSITKYNAQNSYFEFVTQYGFNYYEAALKDSMKVKKLPQEYTLYIKGYCVGAGYLMIDWIRNGCVLDTAKLAEIIFEMMPSPLRDYFS